MNLIFHALLGILLAKLFNIYSIPNILIGVLFAIFPDFDHIPYLKKAFKTKRFGIESRSFLHELLGLLLISSGSLILIFVSSNLSLFTFSCGLSHFIVDFLTRPTRPLFPFSEKTFDLKLFPKGLKEMIILDSILTAALYIIYLII